MQGHSITELCKLIGIARSTFYLMLKEGRAPAVTKLGSRSVVFERDYLAWLDKQPKH